MKRKTRVLFLSTCASSFVKNDIRMLGEMCRVKVIIGSGAFMVFRILFFLPFFGVSFCWFGTVYSAIAVIWGHIWRKKAVIVLGGVDVAKITELNYGIWMVPWKARLLSYAYKKADALLAVSPSFKNQVTQLAGYDGLNIHFVPTAYDTDFWKPEGKHEERVLTVAHAGFKVTLDDAFRRFRIKGLDILFSAARLLPDISFTLVGYSGMLLKKMNVEIPPNMQTVDYLEPDTLREYYRKTKVYCQPSLSEGLPNTLCEAMACGCIPIGSNAGGIPEVIGNTGFVVPYGNPDELADAISKCLRLPPEKGDAARDRIAKHFSPGRRKTELIRYVLGEIG